MLSKIKLAACLIATLILARTANAQPFDKPIRTTVLHLGHSENLMPNDKRQVTLTCSYYAHFMIKQKDDPGMKGAELIAITPLNSTHPTPCTQTSQPGEQQFQERLQENQPPTPWNGYFAGVKDDLIFLERPDGDENSGIPFAAFQSDASTIVFEDSVALQAQGKRELNFLPAAPGQITLHYLRVASAGCSIPKSGQECWNKLRQLAGISPSPVPKCTDYEGNEAGTAPSVIAYPVEVSLYPKPSTHALGSAVKCYPQQ